ncbi:predicted protein [Postia placenta Mad-698-R]|uniref:Uncharacterized protein n=1 Tax=Postia placenta MAD-698-R-SB12 TaxID=670580 RepID=A0A1X6MUG9_9APHY|nr:hypothetical protein POSPLADRAFT_1149052 [Postia placenta MAD-698-R-SB12]EED85988.1 predicted protein [Postia placenta Mad-698-R]OSX59900.1 hypothetical protein POSPLADRAFT_1149052 [Postia placenta MAD-698-R-SB12]
MTLGRLDIDGVYRMRQSTHVHLRDSASRYRHWQDWTFGKVDNIENPKKIILWDKVVQKLAAGVGSGAETAAGGRSEIGYQKRIGAELVAVCHCLRKPIATG